MNQTDIENGMRTAFLDYDHASSLLYRPQFIYNDHNAGKKTLVSIEEELKRCDEFSISVAFITKSGITPLLQTLKELEEKNIPGRIMTTDYLTFSEPAALRKLSELKNIEVKVYSVDEQKKVGFHTKGYIFKENEIYRIIIGSSNLTSAALTRNKEWNTKIISTSQGEFTKELLFEFNSLWNVAKPINLFIDRYEEIYKERSSLLEQNKFPSENKELLEPKPLQEKIIVNLKKLQEEGKDKALLISATGTGKTYASAFALRQQKLKRALFVVHREQIAKQALNSYRKVFGKSKTLGLLSGNEKNYDSDLVFATMQTLSKSIIYENFKPDDFDTIVIDEVHHAGAASYRTIMDYFKPNFWLGMTASPDRPDGFDIYDLFDHNIAYEIRLQKALEEDILCPFHYFGIIDIQINGELVNDVSSLRNFNRLICDDRVNYIIEKAEYFGYSGKSLKGLIFCSTKKEAKALSNQFNLRGYRTLALTGEDSQDARESAITRLTLDDGIDKLDYLITVDIFNEGVDIPEINQVIMLRPTESPIVFVQQLGRGLRKCEGKEYVVILDFIGNYKNNFMIPMALSGDRSYNKDTIRRYVLEGSRTLPGSSTIHFDEISRKQIFESINKMSTTKKLLIEKYLNLKNKIGKIPTILDFYNYGDIDPLILLDYSNTYHDFLYLVDKEYAIDLSERQIKTLEFISNLLVNGKRPHELVILEELLTSGSYNIENIRKELNIKYEVSAHDESLISAIRFIQKKFMNKNSEKNKYKYVEFLELDDDTKISRNFYSDLQNVNFKSQTQDLIQLGLLKFQDNYKDKIDMSGFALYQKYSRKDVCRILNWEHDEDSTMFGYSIKYSTCPIFVTYEKKEDITSSTKYEDRFINDRVFSWMTRSRVSINSKESSQLINWKSNGLKIYLFVKKSDGEGSDFYYLGEAEPIRWHETTIKNDMGISLPIMNFELSLKNAVREDIYDYLAN